MRAYLRHQSVRNCGWQPIRAYTRQRQKPADDVGPVRRVFNFWMELQCKNTLRGIFHGRKSTAFTAGAAHKPGRQHAHLIAMAHPNLLRTLLQQRTRSRGDCSAPILALLPRLHIAAQRARQQLHPVADAQHRHARGQHETGKRCRTGRINTIGAAGQNKSLGLQRQNTAGVRIPRKQLAVCVVLAHTPRNQLRIL